ncbi:hypothetical protein [Leifsonia sp. Leaf264]|uniref:hypothetical protein n=1 Tax=Leifsonia sp. Leaf264 TaxID=1736314 RepID=UPI0006F2C062|nr:hypothetical protein [Leifsonia sp. Leaf264]KQO98426.1 hypothetical protein ASF30_10215 [Leifsonia sp. Leaf264]
MATDRLTPSRTRSVLVGALIASFGILIGLCSIVIAHRVHGDLTATITAGTRHKALWPAWAAMTFLIGIGVLGVAAGTSVAFIGWRAAAPAEPMKPRGRAAFIVIKSAEGRRSGLRRNISPEELERQREALHQAGIRRIEPALGRHQLTPPTDNTWGL